MTLPTPTWADQVTALWLARDPSLDPDELRLVVEALAEKERWRGMSPEEAVDEAFDE